MKKKSLLILPVLLLALAACNNEEEDVEEDNTPGVTDTTDGNDGTSDDGDGTTQTPPTVEIDARIIVTTEAVHFDNSNIMYENSSDLTIRSTTEDESGNITYTLRGTASAMSTEQADEFWNGVAAEGDLFIVVTVSLEEGETVSWTTPDATTKSVAYAETENGDEDMIIRISGTYLSTEVAAGQITFTIADETAETSVDHIVDFSSVCQPAPVREPITTVPEGSIGVLDFSGIEKSSNYDQSADDLNALFAESWVPTSDVDVTSTGVVALEGEEQGTTLPFEVKAATKVLLGAGGSATSGNTGNTHWQLSTQCIKLSNSPTASGGHVDGSFTLDFGETAVSKVEIEALAWSTTEEVTLDVAEAVSEEDPAVTAETEGTSAKTITSAANDLDVETPEVLTWELGEDGAGVNSITISATKRALIFSIAFWTVAEA